jgi:hypothetical protein
MSRNVPLPRLIKEASTFQQLTINKMRHDDFEDFGPFVRTDVQKANYKAQPWDLVECDPSSGTLIIELPDPSAANSDAKDSWVIIKNATDSGAVITVRVVGGGKIDGQATATVMGTRACQAFIAAPPEWQSGPSGARPEGFPSGPPIVLTFPLSTGSADATVFTVPAAPSGAGRFTLQRVEVRLSTPLGASDTGTVLVRVGTTLGGNDIGTDQLVDKTTPVGTIFSTS